MGSVESVIAELNSEFTKRYENYIPDWTDAYTHIVVYGRLEIKNKGLLLPSGEKSLEFWNGITGCFREYISRKGKGLRPLLFLSSYMAASGKGPKEIPDEIWSVAFAIEMFNSAALAGDDFLDGGKMRRGGKSLPCMIEEWYENQGGCSEEWHGLGEKPTKEGFSGRCMAYFLSKTMEDLWLSLRQSIVGIRYDHAYYTVWPKQIMNHNHLWLFDSMSGIIHHLSSSMATYCRIAGVPSKPAIGKEYDVLNYCLSEFLKGTLDGEKVDYWWSHPDHTGWIYDGEIVMPSIEDVLWLQRMKTTLYSIKFPLVAGALLGGLSSTSPVIRYLESLALAFGEAFQIYDDLLVALPEKETGKSSLSDLANGSRTIVTVGVYELLPESEKQGWVDLLERCKVSEQAREDALGIIQSSGIVQKCDEMIRERMETCEHSIQELKGIGYGADLPWVLLRKGIHWMDDGLVVPSKEVEAVAR